MKNNPKAIIFGCASATLTPAERHFFERTQPLGFILFLRNCQNPDQVSALTQELRSCVDHDYVPILIDQEGGSVARLKSPHWRQYPEPALFGQIAEDDINLACWAVETNAFLIGTELDRLGVNVNCAPMIDLQVRGAHKIMGGRAFHESADITAILAYHALKGYQRAGIVPVMKHLPGHGRSLVDSHEDLPVVQEPLSELQETDFFAFKTVCSQSHEDNLPSPWGMTAHIIYSSIDRDQTATLSEKVIEKIIREFIGFKGFLVTDDLNMKALKGDLGELAQESLSAGCDAALHCSGKLDEMIEIASHIPPLTTKSMARLKMGMVSRHTFAEGTEESLWVDLNYHLKPYWGGTSIY